MSLVTIDVKPVGPQWNIVHWEKLKTDLDREIVALVVRWTQLLANEARSLVPQRTGRLSRSIRTETRYRTAAFGMDPLMNFRGASRGVHDYIGIVYTKLEYAPYVEFGTGIYSVWPGARRRPITPRNAKAFKIPVGGTYKSLSTVPATIASFMNGADPAARRRLQPVIFRNQILGQHPQLYFDQVWRENEQRIYRDYDNILAKFGFFEML